MKHHKKIFYHLSLLEIKFNKKKRFFFFFFSPPVVGRPAAAAAAVGFTVLLNYSYIVYSTGYKILLMLCLYIIIINKKTPVADCSVINRVISVSPKK